MNEPSFDNDLLTVNKHLLLIMRYSLNTTTAANQLQSTQKLQNLGQQAKQATQKNSPAKCEGT